MEAKFIISELELERIMGLSYNMGSISGIDTAARHLYSRSGDYYADGNDDLAKHTRYAANFLSDLHKGQLEAREEVHRSRKEILDNVFSNPVKESE